VIVIIQTGRHRPTTTSLCWYRDLGLTCNAGMWHTVGPPRGHLASRQGCLLADDRWPARRAQHSRREPCRPIARHRIAPNSQRPSKEGCNRGRMIPLAPGTARSSGSLIVHDVSTATRSLAIAVTLFALYPRSAPAARARQAESVLSAALDKKLTADGHCAPDDGDDDDDNDALAWTPHFARTPACARRLSRALGR
jgi:hypothetical protein